MRRLLLIAGLLVVVLKGHGQTTRVLFIGNSYTDVNNLPALFQAIAQANGDSVVTDKHVPGGYTFEQHAFNATTIAKIYSQPWDFVVLQEQSQRPSFSPAQVAQEVYPYASLLDSMIHDNHACSETVFYMTWGRKNGDANNCVVWPPVCTYEGMQARLRESYMEMAMMNFSTMGPVGAAWRYMRSLNPAFDLYQPDESHPSLHGSYLAACALYASIFHRSPLGTSYTAGLPQQDATAIQAAVKAVVSDSIAVWYQHGSIPMASFSYSGTLNTVQFQNHSLNVSSYTWDFGDGNSSTNFNETHTYQQPGTYTVTLTVTNGCRQDVIVHQVTTGTTSLAPDPGDCRYGTDAASGQMYFECNGLEEIQVFDSAGRKVGGKLSQTGHRLVYDYNHLPPGFYVIRVTGQGKSISAKLMR